MKRRRDFYAENRVLEPGEVVETFNIAEDEIISLSIQFYERNKWVVSILGASQGSVFSKVAAETGGKTMTRFYLITHMANDKVE